MVKSEVQRKYDLDDYKLNHLTPFELNGQTPFRSTYFVSDKQRDWYFRHNPEELEKHKRCDKLCINIRWDTTYRPKSILQCYSQDQWVTIWENQNAKITYNYGNNFHTINMYIAYYCEMLPSIFHDYIIHLTIDGYETLS